MGLYNRIGRIYYWEGLRWSSNFIGICTQQGTAASPLLAGINFHFYTAARADLSSTAYPEDFITSSCPPWPFEGPSSTFRRTTPWYPFARATQPLELTDSVLRVRTSYPKEKHTGQKSASLFFTISPPEIKATKTKLLVLPLPSWLIPI